jgi:hypothetical protein
MNALDCLEYIDAELIEEAGFAPPRRKRSWTAWAAAAACLCLLLGGGLWLRGREAAAPGVRKWSASMSAADYFRDCGGDRGPGLSASDSIAMPPYAAELSLDGERRELEVAGVLPPLPDHPAQHFWAYYNGDGSLYKLSFWWMERPEDETGGYSDLRLTAAPKELHEVRDVIVITKDEAGKVIPPRVTVTERDGIRIVAEGGEHEAKTLTWQTEEGWYQLYASGTDGEERIVALLDWLWAHPLSLEPWAAAGDGFIYSTREEQPGAFREQIPDFEALGYEAEEELVNLAQVYKAPNKGDLVPVWFEGVYTRGETRVSWTVSTGADADAWDACLGRPEGISEEMVTAALSERDHIGFDLYYTDTLGIGRICMATLRLERGSAADAWEIVRSMAG